MIKELRKLLKDKATYISFCSLMLLIILGTWIGYQEYLSEESLTRRLYSFSNDAIELTSPFNYWVGNSMGMNSGLYTSLYYFIFPLAIALPLVDMWYRERESKNIEYQFMRMSRKIYFLKKVLFMNQFHNAS